MSRLPGSLTGWREERRLSRRLVTEAGWRRLDLLRDDENRPGVRVELGVDKRRDGDEEIAGGRALESDAAAPAPATCARTRRG
jgi:hypothetical protein